MAPRTPPIGVPLIFVPLLIAGQRTADVTGIVRFKLPAATKLIGVQASARASGGTTPTLAVDVLAGGTSVLAAPIAVTAGAVAEGAVAGNGHVADESVITVDLDIGGTNPTWDDICIGLTLVRR